MLLTPRLSGSRHKCRRHRSDADQNLSKPQNATATCEQSHNQTKHPNRHCYWDPLIIGVLFISIVEVPFGLSFDVDNSLNTTYGKLTFVIDILLCLDIVYHIIRGSVTAFTTGKRDELYMYLKGRFVLDLFVSVPFDVILPSKVDAVAYVQLLRIIRVFRMARIARVLKLSKSVTYNRIKVQFEGVDPKYRPSAMQLIYIKLTRVVVGMIIGAHYFACLWWAVGTEMAKRGYDSWVDDLEFIDAQNGETLFYQYTVSLYWSVVTLFTTGYGDISARNVVECWVCILSIVTGTIFIAYMLGIATVYVGESVDSEKIIIDKDLEDIEFLLKEAKKVLSDLPVKISKTIKTLTIPKTPSSAIPKYLCD